MVRLYFVVIESGNKFELFAIQFGLQSLVFCLGIGKGRFSAGVFALGFEGADCKSFNFFDPNFFDFWLLGIQYASVVHPHKWSRN